MTARTLDLSYWEAGQRIMQRVGPTAFHAIVVDDKIVMANRESLDG